MLRKRLQPFAMRLALRWMLKYLELNVSEKDNQVEDWLAAAWMSPGFRKYIGYREGRIIYELSGGSGMEEKTRDAYVRTMGMRLEILALGLHAKNAHTRKEKAQREKLKTNAQEPGDNA